MDSSGISVTALFTGQVWYVNGLSARFFTSARSRWLYRLLQPSERLGRALLGLSVEDMLLQRHLVMDHRIDRLVREQGLSQILEIACGYSPRGYKLSRKYPGLRYVEADLPDMAARKNRLLARHHGFGPDHQVVPCDIFAQRAPLGLEHLMAETLDPDRPTLVITEGLVNYFRLRDIRPVWSRLAMQLSRFPRGWYLTDTVLAPGGLAAPVLGLGVHTLSLVTRAHVNLHFRRDEDIQTSFTHCGFPHVRPHRPEDFVEQLPVPLHATGRHSPVRVVECEAQLQPGKTHQS